jgi:diacylglycerol kinase (ATP)
MESKTQEKILFIINPGSGSHSVNWAEEITQFFGPLDYTIDLYLLEKDCAEADRKEDLKDRIAKLSPDKIVAVGGDGTVGLVAECVLQKNIAFGILPAGSANGLAKELGISEIPTEALQNIISGKITLVHGTLINGNLCIHLSDVGLNAKMIKHFQAENIRGFWGYFKANVKVAWRGLFVSPRFRVRLNLDGTLIKRKAVTIVIANATQYGSGAIINPVGSLEDDLFEIIVVKQISIAEVFKMLITHEDFNPHKIEVFHARSLQMKLSRPIHFQVDGEYLGKVHEIEACLIPAALQMIMPKR